jgi:anaerobic glycerol-3-phosphate dehydrogenase
MRALEEISPSAREIKEVDMPQVRRDMSNCQLMRWTSQNQCLMIARLPTWPNNQVGLPRRWQ